MCQLCHKMMIRASYHEDLVKGERGYSIDNECPGWLAIPCKAVVVIQFINTWKDIYQNSILRLVFNDLQKFAYISLYS